MRNFYWNEERLHLKKKKEKKKRKEKKREITRTGYGNDMHLQNREG